MTFVKDNAKLVELLRFAKRESKKVCYGKTFHLFGFPYILNLRQIHLGSMRHKTVTHRHRQSKTLTWRR